MKKYLNFIFVIIAGAIIFTGCSADKDINNSKAFVEEQDSQENFVSHQSMSCYANDETGYYFVQNDDRGSVFLYAIDKQTQECHPLCNKSDCLHDEEESYEKRTTCNAFLGAVSIEIVLYDNGFLYYVKSVEIKDKDGNSHVLDKICRKSIDGTKTEEIYSTEDYGFGSFKMHRGYLYLELVKWDSEGIASDDKSNIYRLSTDGKGEPELAVNLNKMRKKYPDMWIFDTRYYGDNILFEIQYTYNKQDKRTIINYDLNTKKWKDIGDNLDIEIDTMFTVFNEKILFGNQAKIYECDFNGENLKEAIDCKELIKGYAYFTPYCNDGKNIYITASNNYDDYSDEIIICDENYKATTQKLPIKFKPTIGFDETAFIYFDEYTGELYWIDKSDYSSKLIYEFSVNAER